MQALLLIPSTVYIVLIPRKYQDVKLTGIQIKEHQVRQERLRAAEN